MAEKPFHTHLVFLGEKQWDTVIGGWLCPLLSVRDSTLVSLYSRGSQLDSKLYTVEKDLGVIRFHDSEHRPSSATAKIALPTAYVPKQKSDHWRKLAILLPFLASLVASTVTLGAVVLKNRLERQTETIVQSSPDMPTELKGVRHVDDSSSDAFERIGEMFDAAGARVRLTLAGINFHITAEERDDEFVRAVQRGAEIRVLVSAPTPEISGAYVREYAAKPIEEESRRGLEALLEIDGRIRELKKVTPVPGSFEIRILPYIPGHRLYLLETGGDDSSAVIVPYSRGVKSSDSPAFRVGPGKVMDHYRRSADWLWQDALPVDEWRRLAGG